MRKHTYKHNYTYLITNLKSNQKYIGVRSCDCSIDQDEYWSSSKYLLKAINSVGINNFTKEVLSDYSTRLEAAEEEMRLHELYDVAANTEYYNKAIHTSTFFDTTGLRYKANKESRKKREITMQTINPKTGLTPYQESGKQIEGKNAPKWCGSYSTPWGIFDIAKDAVTKAPGKVSVVAIRKWCKNPNVIISLGNIRQSKLLTDSMLGKTFGDIGYGFNAA